MAIAWTDHFCFLQREGCFPDLDLIDRFSSRTAEVVRVTTLLICRNYPAYLKQPDFCVLQKSTCIESGKFQLEFWHLFLPATDPVHESEVSEHCRSVLGVRDASSKTPATSRSDMISESSAPLLSLLSNLPFLRSLPELQIPYKPEFPAARRGQIRRM